MRDLVQDETMRAYFEIIGLDHSTIEAGFHLLDKDCDGSISLEEFMSGLNNMKGQAKSLDMMMAKSDIRCLMHAMQWLLLNSGCNESKANTLLGNFSAQGERQSRFSEAANLRQSKFGHNTPDLDFF